MGRVMPANTPNRLPDEAYVVRGGRNTPEQIDAGTDRHPSGVVGVSVESAAGLTVAELAANLPHGQIGVTPVGRVRAAGGDVIPTHGRSPNHVTPTGLPADEISRLLTPTELNSARNEDRLGFTMAVPIITADFNNADWQGRLRLSIIGATRDFARLGIRLENGLRVIASDGELEAEAEVMYSNDEHIWVAKIDWNAIRRSPQTTA